MSRPSSRTQSRPLINPITTQQRVTPLQIARSQTGSVTRESWWISSSQSQVPIPSPNPDRRFQRSPLMLAFHLSAYRPVPVDAVTHTPWDQIGASADLSPRRCRSNTQKAPGWVRMTTSRLKGTLGSLSRRFPSLLQRSKCLASPATRATKNSVPSAIQSTMTSTNSGVPPQVLEWPANSRIVEAVESFSLQHMRALVRAFCYCGQLLWGLDRSLPVSLS